jgi:hypothetical protein
MLFTTDSYFMIGGMHIAGGKPCQDFAFSGLNLHDGAAFAIVSDGCSGGRHTDIGARIVSLTTAKALSSQRMLHDENHRALTRKFAAMQHGLMSNTRFMLGLETSDMLATCLYAYVTEHQALAHVRGDGIVAYLYRDGTLFLRKFEWPNSMPFYPAYIDDGLRQFVDAHGGDELLNVFREEIWVYDPRVGKWEHAERTLSIREGIDGVAISLDPQKLSFLAVMTDGVMQVDGADWKDVARDLLAFKGREGDFAKRRMIRVARDSHASGKGPQDDIAYAVVQVRHNEGES